MDALAGIPWGTVGVAGLGWVLFGVVTQRVLAWFGSGDVVQRVHYDRALAQIDRLQATVDQQTVAMSSQTTAINAVAETGEATLRIVQELQRHTQEVTP